METRKFLRAAVSVVFAIGVQGAHADSYTYSFDTLVSGTTTTTAPWGSLIFSDVGANTVQMSLTLSPFVAAGIDLPALSYDRLFFFNYGSNPGNATNLGQLSFSYVSGIQVASPQASNITTSLNSLQLDGDGKFDIRFTYAANAFNPGESSVYNITRAGGLLASDFNFRSKAEPTNGDPTGAGYYAGLELKNTTYPSTGNTITVGARGASMIATPVPEPQTYAMMLAGLGLMGFVARRRKS